VDNASEGRVRLNPEYRTSSGKTIKYGSYERGYCRGLSDHFPTSVDNV
jgi:hypothetical protein